MAKGVVYRITHVESAFFYLWSIPGDMIQLLMKVLLITGILAPVSEVVGWAITAAVLVILKTNFTSSRVDFSLISGKGAVRNLALFGIEFLPLINLVPGLTLATFLTIRQSRKEDEERASESAKINVRGGLRRTRSAGNPLHGKTPRVPRGARAGGVRGLALKAAGATPVGRAAMLASTVAAGKGGASGAVRRGGVRGLAAKAAGATPIGRAATIGMAALDARRAANDNTEGARVRSAANDNEGYGPNNIRITRSSPRSKRTPVDEEPEEDQQAA